MHALTLRVLLARHEAEDGLGVLVRLLLAGRARVLAVVRQLARAAHVADRVAANNSRLLELTLSHKPGEQSMHFGRRTLRYVHV